MRISAGSRPTVEISTSIPSFHASRFNQQFTFVKEKLSPGDSAVQTERPCEPQTRLPLGPSQVAAYVLAIAIRSIEVPPVFGVWMKTTPFCTSTGMLFSSPEACGCSSCYPASDKRPGFPATNILVNGVKYPVAIRISGSLCSDCEARG